MATQAGKAYVDFEGNYEKLQSGAASATESIAGKMGSSIKGALSSAFDVGTKAMAVGSAGLLAFMGYSIGAAARVQELDITLQALAKAQGISAPLLEAQAAKVKGMGIETSVAQQSVAKMVQTQLDWSKTADLARVAQDAAVISGKNSTQTMQGIMQGIVEANVRVLRDNGIFISAAQAEKTYADQLHITVKDMTEAQKQQAIFNAVLAQGTLIQGTYLAAMDTPAKQIRSLPRLFNDVAVSVGTAFLPAMANIVTPFYRLTLAFDQTLQKGGPLMDWINRMGAAVLKATTPWDKFTYDAINFLNGLTTAKIDKFVGDLKQLAGFIGPLATAMTSMGLAKLPVIGSFLPAISPVLIAFTTLIAQQPALRGALGGIMTQLQPLIATIGAVFSQTLGKVLPIISQLIGPVSTLITTLVQGFGTVATAVLPAFAQVIQTVMPAVIPLINAFGGIITQLAPVIASVLTAAAPVVAKLATLFAQLLTKAAPWIDKLINIIGGALVTVLNMLGPIIDQLSPILGQLVDIFGQIFTQVAAALMPALEQLLPVLGQALIQVLQALMPVVQALEPVFPELAQALAQILIALIPIIPAFVEIIKALVPILIPLAQLIALLAKDLMPVIIAITPLIADLAHMLSVVLAGAIHDITPIVNALITLVGGIAGIVAGVIGGIGGLITSVMSILGTIMTPLGNLKDKIVSFFDAAGGWLTSAGQKIIQGLIDGVGSMATALKNKVGGIINDAFGWIPHSPADWGPFEKEDPHMLGRRIMSQVTSGLQMGMGNFHGTVANLATATAGVGSGVAGMRVIPGGAQKHQEINVNVVSPSDPYEIARETAWAIRTA